MLLKGVNNYLGVQQSGGRRKKNRKKNGGAGDNANGSQTPDDDDGDEVTIKRLWEFYAEGEWDGKNGEFSPNFNMYILPEHKGSVKIGVDDLGI